MKFRNTTLRWVLD